MAMLAGARVVDLEMMQWHPTAIWWPPGLRSMMGTEALRSEGGRIYNKYGDRIQMIDGVLHILHLVLARDDYRQAIIFLAMLEFNPGYSLYLSKSRGDHYFDFLKKY